MGALDQTVVATALPTIILDLRISIDQLDQATWIITGYLLGYTAAMPLVGRLSDIHGRRRVYLLCVLVFVVGSILCGAARSLHWLVAARILQAIGGGALLPVTMAIVGDIFPPGRRSVALGICGAVAEAGGVIGPLYGAFLVQNLGWRWVFYSNVPLGVLILFLAYWACPVRRGRERESIDYFGAAILSAALVGLVLGLSQETEAALPVRQLILGGGVLLLLLFPLVETRRRQPLLDITMFRSLPFSAANLINFLFGCALIVAMVDLPLFAVTVLQRTPLESGLMLIRLTMFIPVGGVVGGFLSQYLGHRTTATLGLGFSAAGLFLMSTWTQQISELQITRDLAVVGFGFGLIIAPVTTTVVNIAGAARAGAASALVTVVRMVGMMVGLSALTSWGLARFNALMANVPLPLPMEGESSQAFQERVQAYQQQVTEAVLTLYNNIFLVAAALCLLAVPAALLLGRRHIVKGKRET